MKWLSLHALDEIRKKSCLTSVSGYRLAVQENHRDVTSTGKKNSFYGQKKKSKKQNPQPKIKQIPSRQHITHQEAKIPGLATVSKCHLLQTVLLSEHFFHLSILCSPLFSILLR